MALPGVTPVQKEQVITTYNIALLSFQVHYQLLLASEMDTFFKYQGINKHFIDVFTNETTRTEKKF